jgi:hypothetical protein
VGTATFLAPFQLLAKISGIQSYNFVPVLNNFYSLKVRSVNLFGTSAFSNLVQLSATPGGGGARLGGGDLN